MIIRPYQPADRPALAAMHAAQGFAYPFPSLDDPIFLSKLVLEDNTGHPVMASLVRLTSEVYLLLDPRAGSPRDRWLRLLALHDAAERDARAQGLADAHAFLPPRVARGFARRLVRLGWVREPWLAFCRKLE